MIFSDGFVELANIAFRCSTCKFREVQLFWELHVNFVVRVALVAAVMAKPIPIHSALICKPHVS